MTLLTRIPRSAAPETGISDDRVAEVIRLHFDPSGGSRFWLDRARALSFDPRERIHSAVELPLLGPLEREDLLGCSVLDLVPRSLHGARADFILDDTGGTTGTPLRAVFTDASFKAGFTDPFGAAARARGFPARGPWLFVGPSGPHIIHRAARLYARQTGELEPFSVDFDPRWARSQTPGSVGARVYLDHVISQALDVLGREKVTNLFSTPPVLLMLAEHLDVQARGRIEGLHLGGMPLSPDDRQRLAAGFLSAVIIPGYGNSLAGMSPEMAEPEPGGPARYAVPTGRLRVRPVPRPAGGRYDAETLSATVEPGRRGRIILDRVDPEMLIANLVERDEAGAAPAPAEIVEMGFQSMLLVDPGPAVEQPVEGGLY